MTDTGDFADFIDTQKATLAIGTITYRQLTDLVTDIDSMVTKHQLTDDTIDNVFSLRMNSLEGNMWVTTSEWSPLIKLTVDVDGVRPKKTCVLTWTNYSGNEVTTTFIAQMKTLRPVDSGIGAIRLFFRLEGDGTVVV